MPNTVTPPEVGKPWDGDFSEGWLAVRVDLEAKEWSGVFLGSGETPHDAYDNAVHVACASWDADVEEVVVGDWEEVQIAV